MDVASLSVKSRRDSISNANEEPLVGDLGLELAATDSPEFRARLQNYEDDIEHLALWLDTVTKLLRNILDSSASLNEITKSLFTHGAKLHQIKQFDFTATEASFRTVGDSFSENYTASNKLLKEIGSRVLYPLMQFFSENIKSLKEMRKSREKILDKYDSAVVRYSTLYKFKDASALREDAFQLYEVRKSYIHETLNFVEALNTIKIEIDDYLNEKVLSAIFGILYYYQNSFEIFLALKPHLEDLKNSIEQRKESSKASVGGLQAARKIMEDDIRFKIMPDSPPGPVSTTKSGYLFKKKHSKTIVPTWKRVYATVSHGQFSYCSVGKARGQVIYSNEINVLLCEVRITDSAERRFCFEINSAKRYFVFQAENDIDLKNWLETFEVAKNEALKGTYSNETLVSEPTIERSQSLPAKNGAVPLIPIKKLADAVEQPSESPSGESNAAASPPIVSPEPISEIPEKFQYNDSVFEKYNTELHEQVDTLADYELVLFVIPCALQKEISLQGRLYLTQSAFYFYSNIFGRITVVSIAYSDVSSVQRFEYNYYSTIKITCKESRYTFKTFTSDDSKTLDAFNLFSKNDASENPLSLQELFQKMRTPPAAESSGLPQPPRQDLRMSQPSISAEKSTTKSSGPSGQYLYGTPSDFEAADPTISSKTAECGCSDHLDRFEINKTFPLPAKFVFEGIFGENATKSDTSLKSALIKKRKLTGLEPMESMTPEDGDIATYRLKYRLPVNNPMIKEKDTMCIETTHIKKAEEYLVYVVEVQAKTPQVPFGDSFETRTKYCITAEGQSSCKVKLSVSINFFKSSMLKGVIKNASLKGFAEYAKLVSKTLDEAAKPIGSEEAALETAEGQHVSEDVKSLASSDKILSFLSLLGLDPESPVATILSATIWYFFLAVSFICIIHSLYTLTRPTLLTSVDLELSRISSHDVVTFPEDLKSLRLDEFSCDLFEDVEQNYIHLENFCVGLKTRLERILHVLDTLQEKVTHSRYINKLSSVWVACKLSPGKRTCQEIEDALKKYINKG